MATEHKHGSMDTEVQEKTFAGFINWTTKTVIVCILALIFIALVNGYIINFPGFWDMNALAVSFIALGHKVVLLSEHT